MPGRARRTTKAQRATRTRNREAETYKHPEATSLLRPDVGTQAQFRKKKPPQRYRYDSSLSPALDWDGQNPAREQGEALIRRILEAESLDEAKAAGEQLKALGRPFLDWAGKAERLSFDVPTLPLFVHERLSTKAILETLKGHKRDRQLSLLDLFNDEEHPVHDQVLKAYEYPDKWVNRLILGDSLVVMGSLLHYENLGGQVQMIYMDPPYGVRFGSNFQPFVRKRDVKHNDDGDLTREPEMVKAYRDTWELGLHSYLTYMRDRLLLCRELLAQSGSIFVQIGHDNVHCVRAILDEVFGYENFCATILFAKSGGTPTELISSPNDFLLWYARDRTSVKYRQLYRQKAGASDPDSAYSRVELPDGTKRTMTTEERADPTLLPRGGRVYRLDNLTAQGFRPATTTDFEFQGRRYHPGHERHWKVTPEGLSRLASLNRLEATTGLYYVRYLDDFPVTPLANDWDDTGIAGFASDKLYVVQTNEKVIQRCVLMTTDAGDLVLDPTCGSGTTAYVAEQWGRRWITLDTSRVPLALARQRVLTATFHYYQLHEERRGPAGGFNYSRRRNKRGEEVGGVVPHVTLGSLANDESAAEEVIVDRPDIQTAITRVTGPFCVEATIPTPVDWEGDGIEDSGVGQEQYGSFVDRMLEVLRRSPVLHVAGGRRVELGNVRKPAKTLSLSAEALVANGSNGAGNASMPGGERLEGQTGQDDAAGSVSESRDPRNQKMVAIVFGPENGAVSEKLVYEAAREANAKSYMHLYVIGFAIQPNARELLDKCEQVVGVPATYVQATPDLMMGDLLKNMRSSQIFSVCGLPEVRLRRVHAKKGATNEYQVELIGLDVFDPATMDTDHQDGGNVPAWFLDTNYNGLCFHVCQAFFPRTAAWNDLKRSLKGEFEDAVWDHLAGTVSAPFEAGEHGEIAVKVIDDRGNELMVVKNLREADS